MLETQQWSAIRSGLCYMVCIQGYLQDCNSSAPVRPHPEMLSCEGVCKPFPCACNDDLPCSQGQRLAVRTAGYPIRTYCLSQSCHQHAKAPHVYPYTGVMLTMKSTTAGTQLHHGLLQGHICLKQCQILPSGPIL